MMPPSGGSGTLELVHRPAKLTPEFTNTHIRLAGFWWVDRQAYRRAPAYRRFETNVEAVGRSLRKGVISGMAAAVIHKIPILNESHRSLVDVTPQDQRKPPSRSQWPAIVHYRYADLPEEDITEINGTRVTTIERTFVDICAMNGEVEGLAFLEAAIRRFGRRKEKFWAHLNRHRGRWGTRKACKVLTQALYGIDSVQETYARYAITHALPKLTVDAQAIFSTTSKNPSFTTYYRADLLVNNWLIIEIDGAIKYHGTPEQRSETYAKQIAREQSIAKHGYYFLRVAPSQIGPALINHINNLTTHIHYDQLPHQHQLVNLSVAPPWWQLREERMSRR